MQPVHRIASRVSKNACLFHTLLARPSFPYALFQLWADTGVRPFCRCCYPLPHAERSSAKPSLLGSPPGMLPATCYLPLATCPIPHARPISSRAAVALRHWPSPVFWAVLRACYLQPVLPNFGRTQGSAPTAGATCYLLLATCYLPLVPYNHVLHRTSLPLKL